MRLHRRNDRQVLLENARGNLTTDAVPSASSGQALSADEGSHRLSPLRHKGTKLRRVRYFAPLAYSRHGRIVSIIGAIHRTYPLDRITFGF